MLWMAKAPMDCYMQCERIPVSLFMHKDIRSKCMSMCVQDVADACKTGAATDIIFGLALGYKSAIIPCLVIAVCIFVSFTLAHMFGIACAALGMLTTLSTGETFDYL